MLKRVVFEVITENNIEIMFHSSIIRKNSSGTKKTRHSHFIFTLQLQKHDWYLKCHL